MKNKNRNGIRLLAAGGIFTALFVLWTLLVLTVDVQPLGQNGTNIGFAALNTRFHRWTGVHMLLYTITDWLGLVPLCICMIFGGTGLFQLVKRKSLLRVDRDLLLLGVYYITVIFCYLLFEVVPINYRPIPIAGYMEASYPSSTTLLVLSVMPTVSFQVQGRMRKGAARMTAHVLVILFTVCMVAGRAASGVHWITDIVGAMLLSTGLYLLYCGCVRRMTETHKRGEDFGVS
ncbi:MAG: phosphatase PAP2 family protein [Oscillospiraceae bacterium]|nr:phosphatase PAP2 family protein [Oscillospiraceae bacterium]